MSPTEVPEPIPQCRSRLREGTELLLQAFPGDHLVIVFLPERPVRLVAEVSGIDATIRPPVVALSNPDTCGQFKSSADEIGALAVAFYREVAPRPVSFARVSV